MLRGERPEVTAALADTLTAAAAALRSLVPEPSAAPAPPADGEPTGRPAEAAREAEPVVQHIEIA